MHSGKRLLSALVIIADLRASMEQLEVKNRFKELDLVDREPEELWIEARNIVQEAATKTIPKKRKCKKAKWLSNEALQIAEKGNKMQGRWGNLQKIDC